MAFKVSNNIVIDDTRNLVNIESANLAGILTASTIKTAADGDIEVGAGGSLTAEAIYVQDQNGNIVGVATINDGGISSFEGLNIAGVVTASSYVGSGADLSDLAAASIVGTEAPTTRENGDDLQDGDLWFDSSATLGGVRQYTYYDGGWVDSNAAPILTNLTVKDGEGADYELAFDGGSLNIVGGSNLGVSVTGLGSTAIFTANLDEHISLSGMQLSGIATMATMKFGAGPEVTTIVTDFASPSDAQLPTAQAVQTALDSVQGSVDAIDITGADFSGVDFVAQSLSADSMTIGNGETPELATGTFSTINTNLTVAGEILEAESVAVGAALSFSNRGGQAGIYADEITTNVDGSSSDFQLPTARAVLGS